jgi:hypothetical protein
MDSDASGGSPDLDLAVPVITDTDVLRRVDCLLDHASRSRRSLWLLFLSGEGVQLPAVIPIDDVPDRPEPQLVSNLCGVISDVLDDVAPGGSAVVALTRPGEETVTADDRRWFHALYDAASQRGTPVRMLCLATRFSVRQLTLDDAL